MGGGLFEGAKVGLNERLVGLKEDFVFLLDRYLALYRDSGFGFVFLSLHPPK